MYKKRVEKVYEKCIARSFQPAFAVFGRVTRIRFMVEVTVMNFFPLFRAVCETSIGTLCKFAK